MRYGGELIDLREFKSLLRWRSELNQQLRSLYTINSIKRPLSISKLTAKRSDWRSRLFPQPKPAFQADRLAIAPLEDAEDRECNLERVTGPSARARNSE